MQEALFYLVGFWGLSCGLFLVGLLVFNEVHEYREWRRRREVSALDRIWEMTA
jgi:hypothetical protein